MLVLRFRRLFIVVHCGFVVVVRHGTNWKMVTADVTESFTTETSEQENDYNENKMLSKDRSVHNKTDDKGLEWKDGSKNRAFFLQNKFKTGNYF